MPPRGETREHDYRTIPTGDRGDGAAQVVRRPSCPVAYRTLPAQRRRNHRALARVLADIHADQPDAVAGRIGAHLHSARAPAEASLWYARAAAAAQRLHADADAAHRFRRGRGAQAELSHQVEPR